jgi:DNA-directed RNA polymerase subunit RPC12/RpoP
VLLPVFYVLVTLGGSSGWAETMPDLYRLLLAVQLINKWLLIFNILPIYPLDGGQILRSLLWFVLGRGRSLMVATILGLIGVAGFIGLAIWAQSVWYGALAAFMLMNCWSGLQHARALLRLAKLPRRDGFACPTCQTAPPVGEYWTCGKCGQPFDMFQTHGVCPNCSTRYAQTKCMDCGKLNPMHDWMVGSFAPSKF